MPTPLPRSDYLVEVEQVTVRTYRVSAEGHIDAQQRYPDGQVIHSEVSAEKVIQTRLEATD